MNKVCQCRFCGKVLLNGEWVRAEVMADVVGMCPKCMAWQKQAYLRKREREVRRFRLGQYTAKLPEDPFQGFR